jgi:hypothetical protein
VLWACLVAFAVITFTGRLYDRKLCKGEEYDEGGKYYKACEKADRLLLRIELSAAGVALLIAVLHFILLIDRCYLDVPVWWAKMGKRDEGDWELIQTPHDEWEERELLFSDEDHVDVTQGNALPSPSYFDRRENPAIVVTEPDQPQQTLQSLLHKAHGLIQQPGKKGNIRI